MKRLPGWRILSRQSREKEQEKLAKALVKGAASGWR
jgi:hypothetical protein